MIRIDGAQKSGSGTIVRYAVALAALLGQPLHLVNARAQRPTPGLRPQHLRSVLACAELCGARTEGTHVGSQEFTFVPGGRIQGGDLHLGHRHRRFHHHAGAQYPAPGLLCCRAGEGSDYRGGLSRFCALALPPAPRAGAARGRWRK
jgi:hypothetical protein